MKRLLQSICSGVLITGILLAIVLSINSDTVLCVLLWQACLVDAIRGNPPERELPISVFIGLFLAVATYSLLTYVILYLRTDTGGVENETREGCGCCGCLTIIVLIGFISLLSLLLV